MRIVRFEDPTGSLRFARLLPDGEASLLEGDLPGPLRDTGHRVTPGPPSVERWSVPLGVSLGLHGTMRAIR